MRNRLLSLLLALTMCMTLLPSAIAETVVGTVMGEGTAAGFGGEVKVTVYLDNDGLLTAVIMEGASETAGIGSVVLDEYPEAFVKADGIVDTYSGATFAGVTRAAIIAAARMALENAGVNPDEYMREAEAEAQAEDETYEADIVIVGAGGAGMTAAIVAADAGRSVILVESQPAVGGNSVKATGGMNAAKTPAQDQNAFGEQAGVEKTLSGRENWADNTEISALFDTVAEQWATYQSTPEGYFDSQELMELDTLIGGKGINNVELVKTLVENSAESIEWLRSVGIELTSVGAFGGASVKRIHRPVNEEGKTVSVGAYMIPRLEAAVKEREARITLLTETRADAILTDEQGAAAGITATGKTGNKVTVHAKAVILTTGGFGANLDMVASYNPALKGFMTTNSAGAQGDGIFMAQAIGAAVVDMDQIQIHPTVQADTAALITEGLRGDGAVLINAEGKRFTDEVGTRDAVSAAEIAQPGSFSWLIVDQKMVDASSVIQGYINRGFMFSAASWEELAGIIGVPADALVATMADWNEKVTARTDADFGRTSFASPLDTPNFYAVKVTAGIHHTMGGLVIDLACRVLNEQGEPISGLFAAGEVTGGVHGANRLGGNAVADFTVFGRIAGATAAAYAE